MASRIAVLPQPFGPAISTRSLSPSSVSFLIPRKFSIRRLRNLTTTPRTVVDLESAASGYDQSRYQHGTVTTLRPGAASTRRYAAGPPLAGDQMGTARHASDRTHRGKPTARPDGI